MFSLEVLNKFLAGNALREKLMQRRFLLGINMELLTPFVLWDLIKMTNVRTNDVEELAIKNGRSYFRKARSDFITKNLDKTRSSTL